VVDRVVGDWHLQLELTGDHVWDAFFIDALISDCNEHDTLLELDNNVPDQAQRLRPALEARNLSMVGPGQELWNHACELCCKLKTTETGIVRMYLFHFILIVI
jgi:hypothetical protein